MLSMLSLRSIHSALRISERSAKVSLRHNRKVAISLLDILISISRSFSSGTKIVTLF